MNWADLFKVFYEDFKKLSFKSKIIVLLTLGVTGIIAGSIAYPDAAASRARYQVNWLRAAFEEKDSVPMSASTRKKLIDLRRSIEADLVADLDEIFSRQVTKEEALDDSVYSAWTISQIAIALPKEASKHSDSFKQYFNYWRHPGGLGWIEFEGNNDLKVPILSWGISAHARILGGLQREDVEMLLSDQNRDGWWGVYVGTTESKFASTYATSVAMIAICDAARDKESMIELQPRMREAIRKASEWLRVKRRTSLWMDYPNRNGTLRPALTGVVLSALARAEECLGNEFSAELQDFNRDYLTSLRVERVPPEFAEVAGLNVHDNKMDHVRVYQYPSQSLGVAYAYSSGYLRQRAEAISWLDATSDEMMYARNIAREQPWVAAEYLIALDKLLGAAPR
jgi:hypothetical protein